MVLDSSTLLLGTAEVTRHVVVAGGPHSRFHAGGNGVRLELHQRQGSVIVQ